MKRRNRNRERRLERQKQACERAGVPFVPKVKAEVQPRVEQPVLDDIRNYSWPMDERAVDV